MKSLATLIGILWIGLGLAFLPESKNEDSTTPAESEPSRIADSANQDQNKIPAEPKDSPKKEQKDNIVSDQSTKGLAGIIRLSKSGVGESVLLSFAKNTEYSAPLNAGDILYLSEMDVSETIIALAIDTAKLQHKIISQLEDLSLNISEAQKTTSTNPGEIGSQNRDKTEGPQPDTIEQDKSDSTNKVAAKTSGEAINPHNTTNNFHESDESYAVVHATPENVVEEVVVEEPAYTENERVSVWREELTPHGEWIQTAEYGLCWRPHLVRVDSGWRPYYTSGRWIYSDHGWYWKSGYTWGHVVFHHGRWWDHPRHGWLWYPDVVWAPSWVSFRSYDAYCGWAPLPPRAVFRRDHGFFYRGRHVGVSFGFGLGSSDFIFVSYNRFTDPYFHRHLLLGPSYYHAFHQSTVINNYNVHVDNMTVINNGIPVSEVEGKSQTKVERVAIRKSTSKLANNKRDAIDRTGKVPTIYREDREQIIAKSHGKSPAAARSGANGPGRIPTNSRASYNSLASGQELGTSGIINKSSNAKRPSNDSSSKLATSRTVPTGNNSRKRQIANNRNISSLPRSQATITTRPSNQSRSSRSVLGTKNVYTSGSGSNSRSVTNALTPKKKVGTRNTGYSPKTIPSNRIWSSPSRRASNSNLNTSKYQRTPAKKNNSVATPRTSTSTKSSSKRIISNIRTSPSRISSPSTSARTPIRNFNGGGTITSKRTTSPSIRSNSSYQTSPSKVRSLPSTSLRSTQSRTSSAPSVRSSSSSSSSTRSAPKVISGSTSSSRSSSLPSKP